MTKRRLKPDGTPVHRSVRPPPPELDDAQRAEIEALTDGLPETLRAFRDLDLLSPGRRWRLERAIADRTRSLTVVLHGVHDPHNQAAILRTAEALGLQEVHLVERPDAAFDPARRITQNADKWVEVVRHASFGAAAQALRARGLTLLATALDDRSVAYGEVDFLAPTALVMGNEAAGLPEEVVAACDGTVLIPMYGLTQSLNVSVATAVVLSHAVEMRRRAWGRPGDLPESERMALRRRFYRNAAGRRVPAHLVRALERGE